MVASRGREGRGREEREGEGRGRERKRAYLFSLYFHIIIYTCHIGSLYTVHIYCNV